MTKALVRNLKLTDVCLLFVRLHFLTGIARFHESLHILLKTRPVEVFCDPPGHGFDPQMVKVQRLHNLGAEFRRYVGPRLVRSHFAK